MSDEVQRIASLADPIDQLRAATEAMSQAQATVVELARLRRKIIQDLHEAGWSYARIGEAAGLSRGRIHQVRHQGPPPEGTLIGSDVVHIATPLRRTERGKPPASAPEDVAAGQRLGELARTLGIEADYEQIPLDGRVDLDRSGVAIIAAPHASKDVAKILRADPVLAVERDAVVDRSTGTRHAPGDGYDIAYLGRLPVPRGSRKVLVICGIRGTGALGVVAFLSNELARVYGEAGNQPFSTVVRVDFDEATGEPTEVRELTPTYIHES